VLAAGIGCAELFNPASGTFANREFERFRFAARGHLVYGICIFCRRLVIQGILNGFVRHVDSHSSEVQIPEPT
jgi:hypothetical protein